jgi:pyridoxine 5-phosphate synthase
MVRLSVNVNKVATLRNSRTAQTAGHSAGRPSVARAARICIDAGAHGITVHLREDGRHITPADVREIAALMHGDRPAIELNLEGDPRPDFLAVVHEVKPEQVTLVPVLPGEITSQAGWPVQTPREALTQVIADAKAAGIRVSLFVDPEPAPIRWAAELGADRVELFTEPYARAHELGEAEAARSFARYAEAAELAASLGLGVNAGHDLDLHNLPRFRELPHLDEVSIGHALMADALEVGLSESVKRYVAACRLA